MFFVTDKATRLLFSFDFYCPVPGLSLCLCCVDCPTRWCGAFFDTFDAVPKNQKIKHITEQNASNNEKVH